MTTIGLQADRSLTGPGRLRFLAQIGDQHLQLQTSPASTENLGANT
jgi:hypothetical protein